VGQPPADDAAVVASALAIEGADESGVRRQPGELPVEVVDRHGPRR
jgi:hypothetical protein